MQQFARDEAGNVWEIDAQGNALRLAQPGGSSQPNTIQTRPADPTAAYQVPQAAANLQRTQLQNQTDIATAPYDAARAQADARKAAADAEVAERNLQAQQATANPVQQRAMADLANDEILAAIGKARQDLQRAGSAGYAARLPGFAQPQSTIDLSGSLSTIASRLTLDKLAAMKASSPTGASGLGSLTEKEGALLRDSVAGLDQRQSPERLLENLAAVERHYRNYAALTNGEDYRDPAVKQKYGIATLPSEEGDKEKVALANGSTHSEADPALRGVNSRIRSMIGEGATAGQIVAFMNRVQPGLGDEKAGAVAQAVQFRAQNPQVPLSRYPISVENREVEMSGTRQAVNWAAQSPIGAYFSGAGDVLTAGTLDNMLENPALARAGMSLIAKENPISSVAGTLTGGALAAAGGEFAAARLGAGAAAPLVGDTLYGAAYGAGSADEGSRLGGAVAGGVIGGAGGAVGRNVLRGGGMFFRGVRDPAAQALREAGVPLTLGQAVANSGRVGRWLKGREDRLSGFSGVGDDILSRRREGLQAFNRAAYDEGLAPIGRTLAGENGENAVEASGALIGNEYDRVLNNVRLTRDRDFGVSMQGPTAAANRLPGEMGENARYMLKDRVGRSFSPDGTIDGRTFQQAVRAVEQDARGVRTKAFGNDFGNVARGARTAMEDLLERQSPGTLDAYLNANTAYRNHSVLADATAAAMNTDGIFTPAQLGQAARQNARQFTGRISAATTDRPFFELQRAGQQLLPSKVPDSGTAGRLQAGKGPIGWIGNTVRNVANAPLYAEGTQPLINRALLDRPEQAVQIGDELVRRARIGGIFGAPMALNYSPFAVGNN